MSNRTQSATGQKTFTYRGAKLYNSIAKDMRQEILTLLKTEFLNIFLIHR